MQFYVLYVFVVLLIAWAIIQLLSKEAPPTPTRSATFTTRPGGLPPALQPADRFGPPGREPAGPRWTTTVERSIERGSSNPSDEVIILSSETLRHPLPVTPRPAVGAVRARTLRRPKPAPAPPPSRPEPARGRAPLTGVSQSIAQTIEKPMPMRPLASTTSLASEGAQSAESQAPVSSVVGGPVFDPRIAFASNARIREALILSELLQPPVALRARGART